MIHLLFLLFFTTAFAQNQQEDVLGSPLSNLFLNRAKLRLAHDLAKARHHLHLRPHLLMQANPNYHNKNHEIQNYYGEPPNSYQIEQHPNQFETGHQIEEIKQNVLIPHVHDDYSHQIDEGRQNEFIPNVHGGYGHQMEEAKQHGVILNVRDNYDHEAYDDYQDNVPPLDFNDDSMSEIDFEHQNYEDFHGSVPQSASNDETPQTSFEVQHEEIEENKTIDFEHPYHDGFQESIPQASSHDEIPQTAIEVPREHDKVFQTRISQPEDTHNAQLTSDTLKPTNTMEDYYGNMVDGEYLRAMDKKLIKLLQQIFGFLVYAELRKQANSTSINVPDGPLNWPSTPRASVPFPSKPLSREGQDFWKLVQKNIKTYAKITGPIDIINGTDRVLNITDHESSIQFHPLKNSTDEVIDGQNTKIFDQKMTEHLRKLFKIVLEEQAKKVQQAGDHQPITTDVYPDQNDGDMLQAIEETTESFIETTTFVPDGLKRNFTKKFEKLMGKFMHKMFTYMMSEKVLDDIYSDNSDGDVNFDTDGKLKSEILGAVRNMTIDYEKAGHEFYQYIKKHIRPMGPDGKPIGDDHNGDDGGDIDGDGSDGGGSNEHEAVTEDASDKNLQNTSNGRKAVLANIKENNADDNFSNERNAASDEDEEFEKKYRPRMTKLLDRMMKHMIRKEKFERTGQKEVDTKDVSPPNSESTKKDLEPLLKPENSEDTTIETSPEVTTIESRIQTTEDTTGTEENLTTSTEALPSSTEDILGNIESVSKSKEEETSSFNNQEDLTNSQPRTHFKHGISHFSVDHHHHNVPPSFFSHSHGHHFQPGFSSHSHDNHFQPGFSSHSQDFNHFSGGSHGHKQFSRPVPSHITINKQQNFVSPNPGHFGIGQNNQGAFTQFSSDQQGVFVRNNQDQSGGRQKRHAKQIGKPIHHTSFSHGHNLQPGFQQTSFDHRHHPIHHFSQGGHKHKQFHAGKGGHFVPSSHGHFNINHEGFHQHHRQKRHTTQFTNPHSKSFSQGQNFQPGFQQSSQHFSPGVNNHQQLHASKQGQFVPSSYGQNNPHFNKRQPSHHFSPNIPNHKQFPSHGAIKHQNHHSGNNRRIPEEQFLGNIIWAPRNRRIYKRSIPLLKLIADPDVKLDMTKTMENVGTIAKNSFEDQKAPMYHIRNMIGSAKNVILSTMKIPPQDAIIPSQYKILDRSNMKKLQAPQMRSRFRDTSESVDLSDNVVETFQRVGAMLRDSIKSGQEALQHMTDVAHSARKAVVTTGLSTPRLLMPYVKATAVKKERNPEKVMLIAPRIADLTREDDEDVGNPAEEYIKIGDLMDAFGVSNPERKKVGLTRFVMHPKKADVKLQARFSGDAASKKDENKYFITAENIDDGDVSPKNEFDEAVNTLKHINTVIGAKPLKSFLSKIKEELSKDPQDDLVASSFILNKDFLTKPFMGLLKPEKHQKDSNQYLMQVGSIPNCTNFDPDEILKMADEDLKEILKMHNEQLEEDEEVEGNEGASQAEKSSLKTRFQKRNALKNVDLSE